MGEGRLAEGGFGIGLDIRHILQRGRAGELGETVGGKQPGAGARRSGLAINLQGVHRDGIFAVAGHQIGQQGRLGGVSRAIKPLVQNGLARRLSGRDDIVQQLCDRFQLAGIGQLHRVIGLPVDQRV